MSDLTDALMALADLDEQELAEEIVPELGQLCQYAWLMRLILAYCERRK